MSGRCPGSATSRCSPTSTRSGFWVGRSLPARRRRRCSPCSSKPCSRDGGRIPRFTTTGLPRHGDARSQYTSLAFTEALHEAAIADSIGSAGYALDNALTKSTVGLFNTKLVDRHDRSWTGRAELERQTAAWDTGATPRSFQDHVSLRILKGRCMTRPASRLASAMSRRPARWWAPTARLRRPAMTRGPDLVRTAELSSR
jgi:hypothetical protein